MGCPRSGMLCERGRGVRVVPLCSYIWYYVLIPIPDVPIFHLLSSSYHIIYFLIASFDHWLFHCVFSYRLWGIYLSLSIIISTCGHCRLGHEYSSSTSYYVTYVRPRLRAWALSTTRAGHQRSAASPELHFQAQQHSSFTCVWLQNLYTDNF